MAQVTYRGNLAADDFPLLSALQGQTVIVGRIDQDFELTIKQGQRLQKEKQIPQIYYCHNVVPTAQGYQSVGYLDKHPQGPLNDFNDVFVLRDPSENIFLFSPAGGKNYIWDQNIFAGLGGWVSRNPIAAVGKLCTVAYLNGETYIFYEKVGCFRYDQATTAMVAVVLTGLVVANINGICAAQGFLLAWDDLNNIYRSQAASPLDFTPDPALGSGAGIPQDLRGKIVCVLPIAGGYIVYTNANAVAGVFQQNIRYPFIYREVAGSAGIKNASQVSWQDNLGDHYALTAIGLQQVDKSKATPIFPEVTDFITARLFEDYDEATDTFLVNQTGLQLDVHITVVGARFVVISYGQTAGQYTHALIHDLAFKRWGKLKVQHSDCFTYTKPNIVGNPPLVYDFKDILGFIHWDGSVKTVNFSLDQTNNSGVIVLGKFQFLRDRLLEMLEVMVENIDQAYNFSLRILSSLNGKTISSKIKDPTVLENVENFRHYGMRTGDAVNHSIVGVGTFHLTSFELLFKVGGHR